MAKINSRSKGQRGEREFCDWLFKNFDLPEKPERNLEQVRSSGADVLVFPFAYEIKRVETLNLKNWWLQVRAAVKDENGFCHNYIPVVSFRVNRSRSWEFLISAENIGLNAGFIRLDEARYIEWAKGVLNERQ